MQGRIIGQTRAAVPPLWYLSGKHVDDTFIAQNAV